MSKRKVNLSPQFNYEFQKNQNYQDSWQFLKDPDRSKIIASQLTYLDFHSWLHANIKTQSETDSKNIPLIGDISEVLFEQIYCFMVPFWKQYYLML